MSTTETRQLIGKMRLNPLTLLEWWKLPDHVSRKRVDAAKAKFYAKYPPRANIQLARTVEETIKKLERAGNIMTKLNPISEEAPWWKQYQGEKSRVNSATHSVEKSCCKR